VALIGHNGAGKTTTLRLILGLLEPDNGEVSVFGVNPNLASEEIRRHMGVLSEDVGLYESLTVFDNLMFFCNIYGCDKKAYQERMEYLLERFDISDCEHKVIKNFSLGMKKKVALIRTLCHNPSIVLMDEPVNALDPVSIKVLHEEMRQMKIELNTTFIITTHNLDEVVKICDSLVIVKNGRSVMEKAIDIDFSSGLMESTIRIYKYQTEHRELIENIFREYFPDKEWNLSEEQLQVKSPDDEFIACLIKELVYNGIEICEVTHNKFDLDKIYMQVNMEDGL
jgi:ABC-2 type transport system ATP-binding protein